MLPMMVAESSRHRASGRENGSTAATWDMVNGIKNPRNHLIVILPPFITLGLLQRCATLL
jgi:hypothetical protein